MIFIYLFMLLFYVSICGFCFNYYYYLKSLIMMEFILVSVLIVLMMGLFGGCHYIIYILVLGVCESIVGLLLLILICRVWGVDMYLLVDFNF